MRAATHLLVVALAVTGLACSSTHATSSAGAPDGGFEAAAEAGCEVASSTETDAGALVAVPLSACDPRVYSAGMTLGGSQDFQLILDTGSTTLAVAASGCTSCTDAGVSALYQPGPTAVDQHQTAAATYGALESSGWSGEIYTDSVGVCAPGGVATAQVKLVAITKQSQFLVGTCGSGGPPQGVVGFAPSLDATTGTNGFFDQVVAAGGIADVFATRLCSDGGTLWLGGYDPAFTTAAPVYTPMFPAGFNAYVYTVNLASIGVVGTTVPVPTGSYTASLLDTGSSISSIQPAAFDALTAAIEASPAFAQIFGAAASSFFASSGTCVSLTQTKDALDAALPPLTLTFGSSPAVSVTAAATESYLLTNGSGQWCPAMTSRAPSASFEDIAAILGAPMLRSDVVIFDRAQQRVGFAPKAACP